MFYPFNALDVRLHTYELKHLLKMDHIINDTNQKKGLKWKRSIIDLVLSQIALQKFYVIQDENGNWEFVLENEKQIFNALQEFIWNKWNMDSGEYFDYLESCYQRRIEYCAINLCVLYTTTNETKSEFINLVKTMGGEQ